MVGSRIACGGDASKWLSQNCVPFCTDRHRRSFPICRIGCSYLASANKLSIPCAADIWLQIQEETSRYENKQTDCTRRLSSFHDGALTLSKRRAVAGPTGKL